MERKIAVEVLGEIVDACGKFTNINGYQISCREKLEDETEGACEIVIFAALQQPSRDIVEAIVSDRGLKMDEMDGKLTIYKTN